MKRTVWWIGDKLVRLDDHPRAYAASVFVLIWIGVTVGLHFISRWYGGDPQGYTLSWLDAAGVALAVALVGTCALFLLFWRPRGDKTQAG